MNITDLVNRELKKAEDKFGKDDAKYYEEIIYERIFCNQTQK